MNDIVLNKEQSFCSEQAFILRNGRVPGRRKRNIFRNKLQNNLYNDIQKILTENSNFKIQINIHLYLNFLVPWLVVHGIPGCGKSQLVSDILWYKSELSLANFKHIFW